MSERGNKTRRHRIRVLSQPVNKTARMDLPPEGGALGHDLLLPLLVPLTSEWGCANKKERDLLAFFFIHVCFENITCLADYMIIIFKGCQGASGIIII